MSIVQQIIEITSVYFEKVIDYSQLKNSFRELQKLTV